MAAIVANCAISLNCELTQPVKVQYIDGNMFSMDNAGNTAHVYVFYNGEPQEIVGSVTADVIRSDGTTVAITGAMSGNRAYVIFPQSCYAVPGVVSVVIKVTEGSTVTTIAAFVANVYRSSTDTIVDPGTIIPSVQNLISAIETAVASIPADYSSLWESLAPDYTDITFPVTAGKYCTYNGTLYIAKVDIATTESFTAAHWQSTNIGDNLSALKSAIDACFTFKGTEPTTIEDSTDYDDLTEIGNYKCVSAASAQTMTHCPTRNAHRLSVIQPINGTQREQIIIDNHPNAIEYKRYFNGTTWGEWRKTAAVEDIPPVDDTLTVDGDSADALTTGNLIRNAMGAGNYDLSSATEHLWTINSSGKWVKWNNGDKPRSYAVPCNRANAVQIVGAEANDSIVAFLKSFAPVSGASVDFSAEYTARITIGTEATKIFIVPDDANYLFVQKTNSSGDVMTPVVTFYYSNPEIIYPTNDNSDRTAEIEDRLNQFGVCRFEKGRYYVKNVHLPDGAIIEGCGAASEIVLLPCIDLSSNLWTDGDQTFTRYYGKTFDTPLPAGRYTFTASVTSNDTDSDKCSIGIYWAYPYNSTNGKYVSINRGTAQTIEFYTNKPIEHIDLMASNTLTHAEGDTATFSDISLTGIERAAAFITGAQNTIKNVKIRGALEAVTKTSDGLRNGILYDQKGNDTTVWRGIISDCFFDNFAGGCICFNQTGGRVYSGFNVDNCYMWDSYAGIDIARLSEFHRINNCSVSGCYYGVLNNGGNNEFTGCNFSANAYGFAIDNSDGDKPNNSHGGMSGCILQHNTTRAVYINRAGAGFVFTGCNMDNGGIEIVDSCRIVFVGINFMTESPMVINGVYPSQSGTMSMIMFNACNMRDVPANTYTITGGAIVKFVNCFTEDGTAIDPTA